MRDIVRAASGSAGDHFLLGYVLLKQARPEESLAEYTRGAQLRTPSPEELTEVASDYILLKDYADAERWLLRATEAAPHFARAWYLLGRTQYNEDHAAAALASFEECLKLTPRDARAKYNGGLAYEKLGRLEEAEQAYTTAIAWQATDNVHDPQPYLDLGILLLTQQKKDRALAALRQAVAQGANNPLAHQELGLAYESLGNHVEALKSLKTASDLAPEAVPPHFFLGRVYRELGRSEDAKAEFATAARLAGSHGDTATPNTDVSVK